MPLTVECPSCSARITAPDKLAGKTARCPKCREAFTLPMPDAGFELVEDDEPVVAKSAAKPPVEDSGFEVVEDDEPVVAKPRKKPRPPVVEEDEYEEERTTRRKKQKKGLSPAVLYGSIAGVIALIGLAVGVYFLVAGKGGGGVFGPNWVKFDAPDGSFSTSFPGGAPEGGDALSMFAGVGGTNAQQLAQAKKTMEQMGMSLNAWTRAESGRKYIAGHLTIPQQMAALLKPEQLMSQNFNMQGKAGGNLISQEDTTVAGQKAKQILGKGADGKFMLMRIFIVGTRVYVIGVEGDDSLKADDVTARQFFDKFELKK